MDMKDKNPTITNNQPGTSRYLLVIAVLLIALTAVVVYLIRTRNQQSTTLGKEAAESKLASKEGEEHHGEHGEHDEHSQQGVIIVSGEMAELVGIKVEPATKSEIEDTITTAGRVLAAPDEQAIIGAKVDGRAVRVLAEPGQQVRVGQPLVIVDSPQVAELRGQFIEAQARLNLAEQKRIVTAKSENRAAVIQSKNRLDLAQANYERKQRLASLGAAAGREVAEAETEYKNAKAEYEYQASVQITRQQQEAESEVEQTRANVMRLKHSLAALGASTDGEGGTLTITTPIAGTVVDRHVSVGEAITSDKELLTVMNTASVIIEALLPESQARRIQVGQRMIARIPGSQDGYVEGKVQSVGTTVDPIKRTVAVRAKAINPHFLLRHEMAVDISISAGERKEALLVSASALVDEEGLKIVYVKEGERYERRPVTVGTITYQQAEILSGVEVGEEVVVSGAYQLANMAKSGGEEGEHHDD